MEDYLNYITNAIETKIYKLLDEEKNIGSIWDFNAKMIDDNNVIVEIEDNKNNKTKYKINIEEIK
jgi:hypothetical protein